MVPVPESTDSNPSYAGGVVNITSKLTNLGVAVSNAAKTAAAVATNSYSQPTFTSKQIVDLEHDHGAHK